MTTAPQQSWITSRCAVVATAGGTGARATRPLLGMMAQRVRHGLGRPIELGALRVTMDKPSAPGPAPQQITGRFRADDLLAEDVNRFCIGQ